MIAARDRSGGFILVAVLMVMALMAALVGSVSLVARSAIGTVRVEVDSLAGEALLDAGVEIAAWQLLTLQLKPAGIDGQQIRLDDGTVTLFVLPTGGAVDLNAGNAELLAAAYRAAKLKGMKPEAFAARVLDWIDPDDETLSKASEAQEYQAAGLAYGPANAPFRSVDELQWLPGVSARDVAALRPYLTVANPRGLLNLFDAPRELLEAVPGFRKQAVDRIVRLRARRTDQVAQQLMQVVPDSGRLVTASLGVDEVVRVRLEARPNRGASRTVEALLVRDPTGREPYRIAGWREARRGERD